MDLLNAFADVITCQPVRKDRRKWTDSNGKEIWVSEMTDAHVANSYQYLKKSGSTRHRAFLWLEKEIEDRQITDLIREEYCKPNWIEGV